MNIDLNDGLITAGLVLLASGLWLYSPVLSLTVLGFILLIIGLYGATR